jgi:hypothetical protein
MVNSFVDVALSSEVSPMAKLLPGRASVIGIEGKFDPSTNDPYGVVVEFLLLMKWPKSRKRSVRFASMRIRS